MNCALCTHPAHEHEPHDSPESGRCFSAQRAGKAKACTCGACADATRLHGLPPRCGCPRFVPAGRRS